MHYAYDNQTAYMPGNSCTEWLAMQNVSFHIAMILYLVAYVLPSTYRHYLPIHRCLLICAVLVHMIWGAKYWCTYDFVVWGLLLLIQNFAHLGTVLYSLRRITFNKELEALYAQVFAPYKVTRQEFKSLVSQHCRTIRCFPGDKYSVEGCTSVDERVSVLIRGSMRVTYRGEFLHDIHPQQLIDSTEWDVSKLKRGEVCQVTTEVVERGAYLCWNREKLQFYLQANPKLESVFEYFRGNDIFNKIHETAANAYRRNIKNFEGDSNSLVQVTGIREGILADDPKLMFEE